MKAINIVMAVSEDCPESHFVEIENDKGQSISIGKVSWNKDQTYWTIRITEDDLREME